MEKFGFCVIFLFFVPFLNFTQNSIAIRTIVDGSEQWGYVKVRPKAHMFYWLYKSQHRVENVSTPWPTVLWLQGGPGASSVEIGNFLEVGPSDYNSKPRNSTWLKKADLLFVDNPVGTGFSFVEDTNFLVKSDEEAAADLTRLLIKLFRTSKRLQKSPLFIHGTSYGGRFAALLALSALEAIESGELKARLGGVLLGGSWISPIDSVFSWGSFLFDMSRLDNIGVKKSNNIALMIKDQIDNGLYANATVSWGQLEDVIVTESNVNLYNIQLDFNSGPLNVNIEPFLNGVIRKKLKIIPHDVKFGYQSNLVFDAFATEFMKPKIHVVDKLLRKGVDVTIYNGQLDVICSTRGTETWMNKLLWEGLHGFLSTKRKALFCGNSKMTTGFTKSFKNLHFYWILGAGHHVPVYQPCSALQMLAEVVGSPMVHLPHHP